MSDAPENTPKRPDVSDTVAVEALERLIVFLLAEHTARQDAPVAFAQALRSGLVDAASEASEGNARTVADYLDWLLALNERAMRRRAP